MYIYLCVGGPLRPKTVWKPLDTPHKAYDYGNALGKFLRGVNQHIIWSPGTDQNPDTVNLQRVDDVAEGIADGVNGISKRDGKADYRSTFMSYHTCGRKCSADYFHNKPWLDFNGFQSWRSYEVTVPMAQKQYRMKPAKPGIDHEPAYEGDLSHKEKEVKTGWHTRLQAYWSLFAGSCGHINGTTGIWDLGTRNWRSYEEGLRSEGRTDLQWVRKLIESKPLASRVPDQSLIVGDQSEPDRDKDYICATRGSDRSHAWVYSTNGRNLTVDMSRLKGRTIIARWYDPRTGKFQKLGTYTVKAKQQFDPPGKAEPGNDWVLVLDSTNGASAAPSQDGSGPPAGAKWKLTFSDEFDGTKIDGSKWIPRYQWGSTHNYNAYCDPNNVIVANGLLRLKVEDKSSHGKKFTSAVVTTYEKFSQKYGYFEGRFKVPSAKGFWPAFWMLPYPQHWPPEIDIFEMIRDDPHVYMTFHWKDGKHKSKGTRWKDDDFSYSKEFHTYGVEWDAQKIVWYIDGVERTRFTDKQWIPHEPMYILINFGIDAKWPGPTDKTKPFPSYYECDWVRVYSKN